jgi:hypothetical protein
MAVAFWVAARPVRFRKGAPSSEPYWDLFRKIMRKQSGDYWPGLDASDSPLRAYSKSALKIVNGPFGSPSGWSGRLRGSARVRASRVAPTSR